MNVRVTEINILRSVHTVYDLNGEWHRPNGPAYIWANGVGEWMLFGNNHRYYGPQCKLGSWWIHGGCVKQDG